MRPETEAWMEDAEYDVQSAKVMLDSRRYFFVVFMCHLTIEKLLIRRLHVSFDDREVAEIRHRRAARS